MIQLNQKVSQEDLEALETFKIDFTLVDKLVKRLTQCFPSDEKLNKAVTSLVEVIAHHF